MSKTRQEVFEALLFEYRIKWELPDWECSHFLKLWRESYEKAKPQENRN